MLNTVRNVVILGDATPPDLALFAKYGASGFLHNFARTDRTFQEAAGTTLADDATEAVAIALEESQWSGKTYAQIVAEAAEKITNGSFGTDASGWTAQNSAILAAVAGRLRVTNAGPSYGYATQQVSAAGANKFFRMSAEGYVGLDADMPIRGGLSNALGTTPNTNLFSDRTQGEKNFIYTQAGANVYAHLGNRNDPDAYNEFDNVSVKEIPGNHAIQSASTSHRPLRQADGSLKGDATDDNLLSVLTSATSMTLAAKIKAVAANGAVQTIIGGPIGTNRGYLARNATGLLCAGVGSDGTGTIVGGSDIAGLTGVAILTFAASGNVDLEWYPQGGAKASLYSAAINGSVTAGTALRLWATNAGGTAANWGGDYIYTALAIQAATTSAERQSLANYWNSLP